MTAKTLKHKKLLLAISIVVIFILTFISAFFIIIKVGEHRLKNSLVADEKIEISDDFDYSADVYHKGKAYNYNEDIINILLIGVDKYTFLRDSQGQADALFLVSLNTKTDVANIFSISRNTLADVDIIGADGSYYSTERQQICLAYSYGKSDAQSSENCVKAVSKHLFGIPINSYYTIYFDAVTEIVDSVGGVSVTLTENLPNIFPYNQKGDTVTIKGKNIISYLRARGDSNAPRLERHKAFIKGFISAAKAATAKDLSLPIDMYNALKKESVTDISSSSVAYLASKAISADYRILSIAGKNGMQGGYESFEADENKLFEQVLKVFYYEKK